MKPAGDDVRSTFVDVLAEAACNDLIVQRMVDDSPSTFDDTLMEAACCDVIVKPRVDDTHSTFAGILAESTAVFARWIQTYIGNALQGRTSTRWTFTAAISATRQWLRSTSTRWTCSRSI